MDPQTRKERRIMACPAVRLSVEIRRTIRGTAPGRVAVAGPPRCSDGEDCEFRNEPACLLTILRDPAAAESESG